MRRRAVIVDDHALFRRSARRLLELEGYEVVGEAGRAEEARAAQLAFTQPYLRSDIYAITTRTFTVTVAHGKLYRTLRGGG